MLIGHIPTADKSAMSAGLSGFSDLIFILSHLSQI